MRRWIDDWGQELAVGCERDGELVAAVWARQVTPVLARDVRTGQAMAEVIMGVSRELRGRRLGTKLLASLQARAATNGVALAAKVRAGNVSAWRLLTHAGFVHHSQLADDRQVLVWHPRAHEQAAA